MVQRRDTAEQIISKLREAEVLLAEEVSPDCHRADSLGRLRRVVRVGSIEETTSFPAGLFIAWSHVEDLQATTVKPRRPQYPALMQPERLIYSRRG